MAMSSVGALCVLACCIASYVFLRHSSRRVSKLPKPPGPKGLPIIGNHLQMPHSLLWEKAHEWSKIYGDLVYIECAGSPMLFINSYDIAVDLLERRSSIYSSRPPSIMINELEGWDFLIPFMSYGDRLRQQRAYFHRFFSSETVFNYTTLQLREAHIMLQNILETPKMYDEHVRRLPGAVIMRNAYGYHVKDSHDLYLKLGDDSARAISEAEEYFLLDFFPWLKYLPEWFPGIQFKKVAKDARRIAHAVRYNAHQMTKEKLKEGIAEKSMTSVLVEENTDESGNVRNEDAISAAAATAYLGGSDTSATVIMTFILAMLKYPEVQRLGQEEIDRVVGRERLPDFGDRNSLPFVRAICREVLRWEIIAPMPHARYTTEDNEYKGFFIPAGTAVMINSWAISRNPGMFSEPRKFKPERWLPGNESTVLVSSEKITFGFGRRSCVGQSWAESLLFITVASILASFNIEKGRNEDGQIIPPNDQYTPSYIRILGPSECNITPRSAKTAELIKQAVEFGC